MSDYTGQPIGGLPIMDEAGRLVGVITESDIFRLVPENGAGIEVEDTDD